MRSVIGDVREVLRRLLEMIPEEEHPEWIEHIQEMKAKYPLTYDHSQLTGPYIIEKLYEITNGDAIISTDVGQHQMWAAQYLQIQRTAYIPDFRWSRNDGIRTWSCNRRKDGQTG